MTCCRPPPGKKSASCSAVSDNLPYRTLERKEPAHDDCHRAPAPGSLHACFREPEDEDRVAQRIADLEVARGRDAHHRQLGLLLPGDLAGVQVDRADQAVLARVPALLVRNPDERATEPQP